MISMRMYASSDEHELRAELVLSISWFVLDRRSLERFCHFKWVCAAACELKHNLLFEARQPYLAPLLHKRQVSSVSFM